METGASIALRKQCQGCMIVLVSTLYMPAGRISGS